MDGDFIEIKFAEPQTLKRIVIQSGSRAHPLDRLGKMNLQIASPPDGMKCSANYTTLATLDESVIDYKFTSGVVQPISCLRLVLVVVNKMESGVANWLIIRNIEIVV